MKKQPVFIINPQASRAHRSVKRLEKVARKLKIKVITLNKPDQLKKAIEDALITKPTLIIFGGGDGTVVSGIEHAIKLGYTESFGIVPLGTSNYFARNVNISLSPSRALRQAIKYNPLDIHLATANNNLFALMLDIGASVDVSQHVTYDLKKRYGQLAYLISSFKALKTHRSFSYVLKSDVEKLQGHCHNILVVNSSLNEQLYLAPDSKLTKPSLTVSVYTGKNAVALILNVFLYIITIGHFKRGIKEFEAQKISIETTPANDFSVDGEIRGTSPVTIKLLEKKVKVACPRV